MVVKLTGILYHQFNGQQERNRKRSRKKWWVGDCRSRAKYNQSKTDHQRRSSAHLGVQNCVLHQPQRVLVDMFVVQRQCIKTAYRLHFTATTSTRGIRPYSSVNATTPQKTPSNVDPIPAPPTSGKKKRKKGKSTDDVAPVPQRSLIQAAAKKALADLAKKEARKQAKAASSSASPSSPQALLKLKPFTISKALQDARMQLDKDLAAFRNTEEGSSAKLRYLEDHRMGVAYDPFAYSPTASLGE